MKPDSKSVSAHILTPVLLLTAAPAIAAEPAVGEVRTCQVVSLALSVGSLEKESKRVVYAPPPGWYIRSHRVECPAKAGASSYAVNTVPADWAWDATESTSEETKVRVRAALRGHAPPVEAGASYRVERTSADRTRRSASHHALVVEATAGGTGFLGNRGTLELTVTAELVYVGPGRE